MNKYEKLKKELEDTECNTCYGSGISFRTKSWYWTCPDCKGSGIIKEDKKK